MIELKTNYFSFIIQSSFLIIKLWNIFSMYKNVLFAKEHNVGVLMRGIR